MVLWALVLLLTPEALLAQQQNNDLQLTTLQQDILRVRQQQAELRALLTGESQDRRSLEGRVETLEFRMGTLEKRLDDLIASLDGRLADIESQLKPSDQRLGSAPINLHLANPDSINPDSINPALASPESVNPSSGVADLPSEPTEATIAGGSTAQGLAVPNAQTTQLDDQQTRSLGTLRQDAEGNITDALPNVATLTVEQRYEQAMNALQLKQYASARDTLLILWDKNKAHPLASNMLYWIGETYYVEGDFERAVSSFARSALEYPEGAKAQASLLKLSNSLGALGRDTDACRTLAQMQVKQLDADMVRLRERALNQYACR